MNSRDLINVDKYAVHAVFGDSGVHWRFAIQLDNNEVVELEVRDGEEIPILLDIARRDNSLFYDPKSRTLTTGWTDPGK